MMLLLLLLLFVVVVVFKLCITLEGVNFKKFCNTLDNGSNVQDLDATDDNGSSCPEEKAEVILDLLRPCHTRLHFVQLAMHFLLKNCRVQAIASCDAALRSDMCFENIIYVDFDLLLQAQEENGLLITTGLKRRRESTTDVSAEIHPWNKLGNGSTDFYCDCNISRNPLVKKLSKK